MTVYYQIKTIHPFLKVHRSGGEPGIFFIFIYFLSQLQHLRPLGYCAPPPFGGVGHFLSSHNGAPTGSQCSWWLSNGCYWHYSTQQQTFLCASQMNVWWQKSWIKTKPHLTFISFDQFSGLNGSSQKENNHSQNKRDLQLHIWKVVFIFFRWFLKESRRWRFFVRLL